MINILRDFSKQKKITTFLNPFSYLISRNSKQKLSYFNIEIDGGLLVILLSLFGFKYKRKSFDMSSLAPVVFSDAIKNNKSVYFIGSKPKVIDLAIKNIQDQFPALNICGYRDGYINEDQRTVVFSVINSLKADYVICGMGTPLQEKFLIDLQMINRFEASKAGVLTENIDASGPCTVCENHRWYSYRKEGKTGRLVTLAMLQSRE